MPMAIAEDHDVTWASTSRWGGRATGAAGYTFVMETEAKFSFREPAAFDGWRRRFTLGPFILGSERTVHVVDTYVDGPGHECLAAGYACRIRHAGARYVATLKSLADAEPGGH